MPPAVIAAGITAAGIVGGGAIAARSAGKASKVQERAANEALAFERRRYDDEQARLQPFRTLGTNAYGQLGQMFGIRGANDPGTFTFAGGPRAGGDRVTIQAPDGSIRQVPAAKREYYLSRGGRLVERGLGGPPREEVRF